jgi:hypothetical protein
MVSLYLIHLGEIGTLSSLDPQCAKTVGEGKV